MMSILKRNGSSTGGMVEAKNYWAYPSRWNPALASFVGWKYTDDDPDAITVGVWKNAAGKQKILSFDRTNAQNMWLLEKVEELLKCKSVLTTDSCLIVPAKDSPLQDIEGIVFAGAPRRQCIYNACVEIIERYNRITKH